jgi:hypothetical protein
MQSSIGGNVNEKVYENRLRRKAKRQQLELVKSRRRDPDAADFGAYWLAPEGKPDRSSWSGPYLDLGEVEAGLTGSLEVRPRSQPQPNGKKLTKEQEQFGNNLSGMVLAARYVRTKLGRKATASLLAVDDETWARWQAQVNEVHNAARELRRFIGDASYEEPGDEA